MVCLDKGKGIRIKKRGFITLGFDKPQLAQAVGKVEFAALGEGLLAACLESRGQLADFSGNFADAVSCHIFLFFGYRLGQGCFCS
jgi:hypothetical protein